MRDTYIPLFASTVLSSLWSLSGDCLKVFLTLGLQADPEGFVRGSVDGLARVTGLTVEAVERHLSVLAAPEKHSKDRTRDPSADGRRIELVPNGWRVVNLQWYREEARRQSELASKRRWWNENRGATRSDARATETKTETKTETESESESPDPERARARGSKTQKRTRTEPPAETPPPAASTDVPRAPLPHEAADARARAKAAPEATGAQPALKYQFPSDWNPRKRHMARGAELGLTESEIWDRVEDVRLKPIKQGFTDEDKHFMRELTWAARDKEIRKAKEAAYANLKDFELPGHRRNRE